MTVRGAAVALVSVLAALVFAGCGGGGDDDVLYTVQFADNVFVACSRDCWGDALEQRIDSGAITCEEGEDGSQDCRSSETSEAAAAWVPSGAIRFEAG